MLLHILRRWRASAGTLCSWIKTWRTAYLPVSFAFRCPHPGTMFLLDYRRCIHLLRSNAELRMSMVLKPTRNQLRWHFTLRRLMLRSTNIQIIPVIPIVQIVTNQDTLLWDVGQKGVEPKRKDRAKRRNNRKRRTMRQRGRIKRKGRTEWMRLYTTTQMTNPEGQTPRTWQLLSLPICNSQRQLHYLYMQGHINILETSADSRHYCEYSKERTETWHPWKRWYSCYLLN